MTDASGAALHDSALEVRNVGTGATQTTVSDSEGRYRVADLGIGDYGVWSSKQGFATVIRNGITLTVGSQNVVDFSLTVGQQQPTITVEAQASQVETTNATVGALVDQAQMRELPLNGRNFEQLMKLASGVQNYSAGSVNANARAGRDPAISVAGSRPNGIALLVDDQSLEIFDNRGLGSVTGTSLGVEAIAEFQTLTNTYGAQFGGFELDGLLPFRLRFTPRHPPWPSHRRWYGASVAAAQELLRVRSWCRNRRPGIGGHDSGF